MISLAPKGIWVWRRECHIIWWQGREENLSYKEDVRNDAKRKES